LCLIETAHRRDAKLMPVEHIFEAMKPGGSRAEFRGECVTEEIPADDDAQHALARPGAAASAWSIPS
jgi:hypothetical protein